jgi:hypothetical protein
MASKDPELGTQGTAVKRKHVTLTIAQKMEIVKRLESSKT